MIMMYFIYNFITIFGSYFHLEDDHNSGRNMLVRKL